MSIYLSVCIGVCVYMYVCMNECVYVCMYVFTGVPAPAPMIRKCISTETMRQYRRGGERYRMGVGREYRWGTTEH